MIVNKVALDYWRLTTFDFKKYQRLVWDVVPNDVSGERGGFQQYKGTQYAHIFHGQGEQGGKTHYLIHVSGERTQELMNELIDNDDLRSTRIDVQLTLPLPGDFDCRELTDALRFGVWPGIERDVQLIDNGGDDTVTVGDRTSDRYIRIYVKEKGWLRFEVEFKGDRAQRAALLISDGKQTAMCGIVLSELNRLPNAPYLDLFRTHIVSRGCEELGVLVKVKSTDGLKRMKWLRSLLPTIRRMMRDHDYGYIVSGWIIDLAEEMANETNETVFME